MPCHIKRLTKEWKKNISKSLIGNKRALGNKSWTGRAHTYEERLKISNSNKGKHLRKRTAEEKKHLSEKLKTYHKKRWDSRYKDVERSNSLNPSDNEIMDSIGDSY